MKRGKLQDVFTERVPGKTGSEAKQLRKLAGDWLKQRRADAELSQADLAARLGLKYYTFISQVENGFSRVPTEIMGAWAGELGLEQATFARHLLVGGPERFSREARAGARRDRGRAGAAARGFRLIVKSL